MQDGAMLKIVNRGGRRPYQKASFHATKWETELADASIAGSSPRALFRVLVHAIIKRAV